MVKPPGISGGAVLLGRRPGWRSREAVGTPCFSWTSARGQKAGVGDEYAVGMPGEAGERLVLARDHWPAPPGHHHPAPVRVPEVRVGQHSVDLVGSHECAELESEGVRRAR